MLSIWSGPKFVMWEWVKEFADDTFKFNLPFPKQQISDSSKLKVLADDNFKFGENSRKG